MHHRLRRHLVHLHALLDARDDALHEIVEGVATGHAGTSSCAGARRITRGGGGMTTR
jgi:hypothetical protein